MLRKSSKLSIWMFFLVAALGLAGSGASAQPVDSDADQVGLIVIGGQQETPTPSPTETATTTPTATTTATATVPAVTDLPETGGSNHSSSTTWVFTSMLFAGALLICCALVSTRTDYDRQL